MRKYKLSEIGKIVSGATPKTSEPTYYGGEIPWLTPADLSGYGRKYISHGSRNITQMGYDSCSTQIMPAGTVLFSSRAPIGYVAIAQNPICTNQGFKSIVPNENVNSEFLYYQLKYLRSQIQDMGSGTTFKEISAKKLGEVQVVLPELDEQERIVGRIEELFSELDNAVVTLEKAKRQLAVYRQAVLKKEFTPENDWERRAAGEIGEVILGRQRSPKNVSNLYPTKYIRAANITEDGLKLDDVLDMEFTPTEREKYYLKAGDIIISEASGSAAQVGKPAIWHEEIPNCCFQNTVIRHRVTTVQPDYLFWYYKYLYLSGYFSKIVGGVGINHLGAKNFAKTEIPLAPYEKQSQIAERVTAQISACSHIEKAIDLRLQHTETLRKSILKRAFEG